ncbi:MAG TPA: phytanoyl-CoA dioxygenase family protein [Mucilaginibacter sp.]|nr:phytanoyl-CoA dioxygenase family protein [Mucilaginibacter sp.]
MVLSSRVREEMYLDGFTVLNNIYSHDELEAISRLINSADHSQPAFRKSNDIFAIRQFFKTIPGVSDLVFNKNLKELIGDMFGRDYFVAKSIYFDKPGNSNWFVAWHQDLTISVDKRSDIDGYGPWTVKLNQFAVQPPLEMLEDNFTVRIHLDDTDENNGALNVIPGSHKKGIWRVDKIDYDRENPVSCNVQAGGINIMRPLIMHSSARTVSNRQRRVIHIEFSQATLPLTLAWGEKCNWT